MLKEIKLEQYRKVNTPHSRLIFKILDQENITTYELATKMQCSQNFIMCVIRGTHNLSVNRALDVRKEFNL